MQELNRQEIASVSGGESLIDRIHRYEWNSYGVPLANGGIFAINMFFNTDWDYVEKVEAPED